MLFAQNRNFGHSYFFLYEHESLQHCFSYAMRKMATFFGFEVRFFERERVLGGQFFLRSRVPVQVRFIDDAIFSKLLRLLNKQEQFLTYQYLVHINIGF